VQERCAQTTITPEIRNTEAQNRYGPNSDAAIVFIWGETMPSTLLPAATAEVQHAIASFWDPASGARFEAHTPAGRPDLWEKYVTGITESYRRFDVLSVLGEHFDATGDNTSLFFVAIGPDENVIAGVRFHGPLADSAAACALEEFAADPEGVRTIRRLIDDRVAFGVAEIKGGWVDQNSPQRGALGNALARSFLHGMTVLAVQFAFCTAATHAISRWLTTGGREVDGLAPVPYPDERYRTGMMWWNRSTIDRHGDPVQLRRFRVESATLQATESRTAVRATAGAV
jgi:hypothetical protein